MNEIVLAFFSAVPAIYIAYFSGSRRVVYGSVFFVAVWVLIALLVSLIPVCLGAGVSCMDVMYFTNIRLFLFAFLFFIHLLFFILSVGILSKSRNESVKTNL